MTRRRLAAIAAAAGAAAWTPAPAAHADGFPARSLGRPAFVLDLKEGVAAADSVEVEVAWEVALRELAFRPEDDVYRARYEVAVIFSRDGRQAAADLTERRVRMRTLAGTRESGKASRGRYVLRLAPGRYDVRATLTDRVANTSSALSGKYEIRDDRSGIGLSDLRLVRYTEGGVERNPAQDVPLGELGHAVRVTVRGAAGAEGSVRIRWRFTGPGGREVASGDSVVAIGGGGQEVVDLPLDAAALTPGVHRADVRFTTAGRSERRTIDVQAKATPAWFASQRERALEILALCVDGEEVDALRATDVADWTAALAGFWRAHDPSPGSAENELEREILARVDAVCTLFVEPFRHPGWKTDRGRIWMRYGRPARRSESAGDFDRPSTEIWEYDVPRHVFIFVDRGSGEYWLSG